MDVAFLRQMYLDGHQRWPRVELAFDSFERHCRELFGASEVEATCEGADLFLCCACAAGDAEALDAFERDNRPVARAAIASVRREEEFVDDALQELWEKLLCGASAKVKRYAGRGPLKAWVRVTATRAALDRCRALGVAAARHVELSDRIASTEQGAELVLLRTRYAEAFQTALRDTVAELPLRERNALRMHLCGGCSIDQIGRAYGVHRATAARWLERGRESIANGLRATLSLRHLKLTDSEFRSLGHGLASVLDLGMAGSSIAEPHDSYSPP
jgi:RNA polymerase sigma-70 factor (ECF subfamily)